MGKLCFYTYTAHVVWLWRDFNILYILWTGLKNGENLSEKFSVDKTPDHAYLLPVSILIIAFQEFKVHSAREITHNPKFWAIYLRKCKWLHYNNLEFVVWNPLLFLFRTCLLSKFLRSLLRQGVAKTLVKPLVNSVTIILP